MQYFNKTGLTWISFLSYAFTGALVVVTGMIMKDISHYFHLSVSYMSNIFTFLNAGILISILLNSWFINVIELKKQLFFGFALILIAIMSMMSTKNVLFFSIDIFILGVVSGITMSIGTFLITYLYSGSQRGSKLLLTDSFFSMSGMIFPILTAYLLEKKIIWYWIYVTIGIIYFLIFLLTINLNFPILDSTLDKKEQEKEKWNINVYLLSIAALMYILGQLGFISWMPQYVTDIIKIDIKKMGSLVSSFWMSYMIGMWCFSIIIKFFNLNHIFIYLTGISTVFMYCFIHSTSFLQLQFFIVFLGFFSSAIYTIIITLASLQTQKPSPKIINFILLFGTIGTMLTFVVTSPIVEKKGLFSALISANILYSLVFFLSIFIYLYQKYKKNIYKYFSY